MFKEIMEWFLKIRSRPLLVVFMAVSISTMVLPINPLDDPFTLNSFLIPTFVLVAHIIVTCWIAFIARLNSALSAYDSGDWGILIGGSGLAFCLSVIFWYAANNANPLRFELLGQADFLWLITLYLLSVETINVPRYSRS